MTEMKTEELRRLAAKIATAYVRANPHGPDQLTHVILQAYQGLWRCVAQPPATASPGSAKKRRRRARPPSA